MSHAAGNVKVILFALFANLGIAIAKFVGAFLSGSASLLAEAIHSLVDCTNQVFLLWGDKQAKRPPSKLHPLGHGREAFFWSFMVAILLFSLGGLFAIYEGVHKLQEHEPVKNPWLPLGILLLSIGLEGGSFFACLKEVRAQNPAIPLWKWFRSTTCAPLLVIFTEDLAALLGLVLATLFLLAAWITGNPTFDAMGSIVIGGLLVVVAWLLGLEVKSLLIGEAPTEDYRGRLEKVLPEFLPGARLLKVIALQTGSEEVLLSYKLTPGSIVGVQDAIDRLNRMEAELKRRHKEIRWQFAELDDRD